MNTDFRGVLGKDSINALLEKGFLIHRGGRYQVGSDSLDCGVSTSLPAWVSDSPYSSTGTSPTETWCDSWGSRVDIQKLTLKPKQTLLCSSSIDLNTVDGYLFYSSRSGMARSGITATAHVDGFSQMDWAMPEVPSPMSRRVMVSVTSRVPVRSLAAIPLFQARFFTGDTRVDKKGLVEILRSGHNLLIDPTTEVALPKERQLRQCDDNGRLITTLHLEEGSIVGFRLKKNTKVLDLAKKGQDWKSFFQAIYAQRDVDGRLFVELQEGEYYLFITNEALNLPQGYVASLQQLDSRLVNAAVHFAEYFGHMFRGAATLEVYPLSYSVRLYQGSPIGAFQLEKIEPDTPPYTGFARMQRRIPQLPNIFSMPKD